VNSRLHLERNPWKDGHRKIVQCEQAINECLYFTYLVTEQNGEVAIGKETCPNGNRYGGGGAGAEQFLGLCCAQVELEHLCHPSLKNIGSTVSVRLDQVHNLCVF